MANNWPDGGERPLSRTEKLVVGCVSVAMVSLMVSGALLIVLQFFGRVSWPLVTADCALGVAVGLLWVRPWETEAPRRDR